MKVYCDNVGAIGMTNHGTLKSRTKHVDIRYHFVRQHVASGELEINFIRTNDNVADLFTKNLGTELHEKFSGTFLREIGKHESSTES